MRKRVLVKDGAAGSNGARRLLASLWRVRAAGGLGMRMAGGDLAQGAPVADEDPRPCDGACAERPLGGALP